MPRLSVVALLAFLGTPVMAQTSPRHHTQAKHAASTAVQWKQTYADRTVMVSIDPQGTIKHADGTYTTHLRWAYTADQPIGRGKSYRIMRETRLIDCGTLRTKPISANTFDTKGNLISSFDTPTKDMQYLPWGTREAGTPSANALAGVCQALKKRS